MTTRVRGGCTSRWLGPALLAAVLVLAGCGKKGPLYLPDAPPAPPAVPAPGK